MVLRASTASAIRFPPRAVHCSPVYASFQTTRSVTDGAPLHAASQTTHADTTNSTIYYNLTLRLLIKLTPKGERTLVRSCARARLSDASTYLKKPNPPVPCLALVRDPGWGLQITPPGVLDQNYTSSQVAHPSVQGYTSGSSRQAWVSTAEHLPIIATAISTRQYVPQVGLVGLQNPPNLEDTGSKPAQCNKISTYNVLRTTDESQKGRKALLVLN